MKKVLLSTCLAIVLVAAFAVTALAVSVSGPGNEVEPGETVTLTVTGEGEGTAGKVRTQGLEITSVSGDFSTPTDFFVIGATGGMSATYTCRVTASAGQPVSFTVYDVTVSDGQKDSAGTGGSWEATAASPAEPTARPDEPTQTPTDEPTLQPSGEPSSPDGEQSVQPTGGDGGQQGAPGNKPSAAPTNAQGDRLPKTGDTTLDIWTLLVIAGCCTAVVLVAGKKVFSK